MRRIVFGPIALIVAAPLSVNAQLSQADFSSFIRYDMTGNITGIIATDPDGSKSLPRPATRYTYNADKQVILTETGSVSGTDDTAWAGFTVSEQRATLYDPNGRKKQESRSSGGLTYLVTQYGYDALGRLQCTAVRTDPGQWTNQSDPCVPQINGPNGPDRITRNVYSAGGQLLTVQKAYGTTLQQNYASYTYTSNGKQASVTDANGNVSTLTYDGFDRLVAWAFPSKASGSTTASCNVGTITEVSGVSGPSETRGSGDDCEKYAYDRNGNRATLMKRDGSIIRYGYDALNRVVQKKVPGSASGAPGYNVIYGYDLRGLMTSAQFGSTSGPGITTSYDGLGRVQSSTTNMDGTSRTLTSQYDADGNRTRLDAPSYTIRWGYDGLDRATSVMEGGGNQVTQLGYNALGQRQSLGLGPPSNNNSPSNVGYGYDPIGRLQSLGHSFANASATQTLGFGYNPASQIVSRTSSNDAYASTTAYNVNRPYTANGLNQYTAAGSASFTYDANGNLTGDGSSTFTYDAENRLVSANGAKNATLSYDPMGRLWQVQSPTATTRFMYDGDRLLQEYDGSGNLTAEYAYGPGQDEPLVWYDAAHGWQRRYLHANHEGSVISLADDNGNPTFINGYDEWGIPNPNNQGRFQYTGQAYLPELGMYYYKARIYSPTLGRFLQTDPIGYKDQINLYAYVGNDPINGRDPTGKNLFHDVIRAFEDYFREIFRPTTPAKNPQQEAKPGDIVVTGKRVPRERASVTRGRWEKATGRSWPRDPATGRYQDVSHIRALADMGDNSPENVKPEPHQEHMNNHIKNGDFKRWGARAGGRATTVSSEVTAGETAEIGMVAAEEIQEIEDAADGGVP